MTRRVLPKINAEVNHLQGRFFCGHLVLLSNTSRRSTNGPLSQGVNKTHRKSKLAKGYLQIINPLTDSQRAMAKYPESIICQSVNDREYVNNNATWLPSS